MGISELDSWKREDGLTIQAFHDIAFSSSHQMLLYFQKRLTTLRTRIAVWKQMAMEGIRWFHRLLATVESIGF